MTAVTAPRSGGCDCGAVRFVAEAVPAHMHACHCTTCRRISGAFTLSVNVTAASLRIEGAEAIAVYASSAWAERAFCKLCGTGLWYRLSGDPEADYVLSAGVLDDLSGLVLEREIFIDRKPVGYALAGDHPRLTAAEFEATLRPSPEGTLP